MCVDTNKLRALAIMLPLAIIALVGCGANTTSPTKNSTDSDHQSDSTENVDSKAKTDDGDSEIVFRESIESNTEPPAGLEGLVFFDTEGKRVALKSYLGKKNVVLVFTEGFGGGMLCPFCKTQTSRLVANYDEFEERSAEILVVYPGTRDHLDEFVEAAKKSEKKQVDEVPFPLVLDEDLAAVNHFKIASNLAHPSTFIIDKKSNVRLAYVGADMSADRPSVAAILKLLDSIDE